MKTQTHLGAVIAPAYGAETEAVPAVVTSFQVEAGKALNQFVARVKTQWVKSTWVLGASPLLAKLLVFILILSESQRVCVNICLRPRSLEPRNVPKLRPPESQASALLFRLFSLVLLRSFPYFPVASQRI